MYYESSIGLVIALVVIVYILKPLFKFITDAFEKGYKDDEDKKTK